MTDLLTDSAPTLPLRCSPSIAQLVTALARAQAAFPTIEKDKTAKIQTRSGSTFSYAYADLSAILAAVRQPLSSNELAVLQPLQVVDGVRVVVTTVLAHASGEWVSSELSMPIADPNDARSVASAATYSRRYGLISLLSVSPADEDDDAAAAVPAEPRETPTTPPPRAVDDALISDAQRKRLFAIARAQGWSESDLKVWLVAQGVGSTSHIRRADYDALVQQLRASGEPLGARTPVVDTEEPAS